MREAEPSIPAIMKIVMADQILTSKILKVANSAYYSLPVQVATLQHAIVYMGFRNMLNIVTAYSLSKVFVKETEEFRIILRHSLKCAYLCRKIGAAVGIDEEEAFTCGLLHDFGKTVILHLLADYDLTREVRDQVLHKYHPQAGSLLTIKWNFPDIVRNAVRFHHDPAAAPYHKKATEIVWLADRLLNAPHQADTLGRQLTSLDAAKIDFPALLAEMDNIEEAARALI
jgi:putative nucleotidyltransferase with HDIG domain